MDISRLLGKLPVPRGLVRYLPGPLARPFQKTPRAPVGPAMDGHSGDDLLGVFEEDEYVEIGEAEEGEEEEEEEPLTEEEAEERQKTARRQRLIYYGIRGGGAGGALLLVFLLWWFGVFTYTFGGPDRETGSLPGAVSEKALVRSEQQGETTEGKVQPSVASEERRKRPGPRGRPPGKNIDIPLFMEVPEAKKLAPLKPAPVKALTEKSPDGPLPRTAGGRAPRTAYARPFEARSGLPLLGVVVTGLGRRDKPTNAAIKRLPPAVTLAFSPYAPDLGADVGKARENGHEVLLELPLEPDRFPLRDPGRLALLTFQAEDENLDRLRRLLARTTGYTGLLAHMGGTFLAREPAALEPYFRELAERGLFFVGNGKGGGTVAEAAAAVDLPARQVDVRLHDAMSAKAVDAGLEKARRRAEKAGRAIVAVPARPITFLRLVAWIDENDTYAFQLAPVSAVVLRPE